MPLRSILLRVLFGSLALAAVFGTAGILFASHETIWRVTGTSIATAGAAVLLLAASVKMEKPASRPACLLGATLVVAEFLLILGAIWELDRIASRPGVSLWLTVLFVTLVGIPAIGFMRMSTAVTTAIAGRVGLFLAAVELVLLLIVAWDQSLLNGSGNWDIEALAACLPPYALLMVACFIGMGGEPRRLWRWAGVLASALAYTIAAYGIISHLDLGGQVVVYITCVAAAVAHANIVMLCSLRPSQQWLRWATIGGGTATALFVALGTYLDPRGDSMVWRLAGACGIAGGCGTLALIVLALINRKHAGPQIAMTGFTHIALTCPVCQKKQTLALGGAACSECHAIIHVRVEEPRCVSCGYSLMMLHSGNCPECGTAVPMIPATVPAV